MKRFLLRLTFVVLVLALGILTSCAAQTTRSTRMSEVKDRHNIRDEQEGAPRVDNAPIER
jgi:curli biogenesis system outer membrane secretion channel CsgG